MSLSAYHHYHSEQLELVIINEHFFDISVKLLSFSHADLTMIGVSMHKKLTCT